LEILPLMAFGGAIITYLLGKISHRLRDGFAVSVSWLLVVLVAFFYGTQVCTTYYSGFFGLPFILRMNSLSWLFAIMIAMLGALSITFSLSYMKGREKTNFYYLMMLLVNASMLGVVLSGDLVSFYIFWEIMSWTTFLLISYNRGPAIAAGMKYIVMSIIGSISMLIGIFSLYASYGTFDMSGVGAGIASASSGYILFILILFSITFGIKNAIMPLHTWLPDAHSEAPTPFSAVLSGILIKMGTYGLLLFMYVIVGSKLLFSLGSGILSFQYILCIIASITIVIPTFIAVLQTDAKRVLAWSSIGQVGYIILGIAFGTSLSFAGGMFHFFNHALFKALLFFTVGAVAYQTKSRDLNSLGGLAKRMPVTFIASLIGIFALIGIPLTNGFVSKWLIYKSLILEGSPFLAFAALIGTWGTILYSYKLIHNMFLGQLPEKYKNVKKAPLSMQIPMVILSGGILLFGILPGIPLKVINGIGTSLGFESLSVTMGGYTSETGALNIINILAVMVVAGVLVWLFFRAGGKSKRVAQVSSYGAGASVPTDKYHYTAEFYDPFSRMIKPYFRDVIDDFYNWIAKGARETFDHVRHLYTGDVGHYAIYIVLFLAFLILVSLVWFL